MAETGNIKTFESPIDKLTPTNVGAEAYEMMGRHVAATYHQAGENIGGAVADVGRQIEQHQDTMQTADLMKNMSDLEVQAHDAMLKARTTMDIHDPDAVNKYMAGFDEQAQAITSKTYTPKVYDAMTRMMSDFNTRARQNFTGYQSNAIANEGVANYDGSIDNWANLGNRDPNFMQVGMDAADLGIKNLPAEQQAGLKLKAHNKIADSTAEGIVSRTEGAKVLNINDVNAAQKFINDPKNGFVDNMSAPKFAEVNARLDNLRRTGARVNIADMELNKGPMLKNISLNGQVLPEYASMMGNLKAVADAGGPEANEAKTAYDKAGQELQNALGENVVRNTIKVMPADKLAEYQDSVTNDLHRTDLPASQIATLQAQADLLDKVIKERHEAFYGGDPAKQAQWEIENNTATRQAYDAWRANPNDPQAFQNYYLKSVADQRFLEPGSLPSVVTADIEKDASRIGNEILHDPKAGPMQAAQDYARMANTYGAAWPSIAGDLAKKKIFNGDQLVAAQFITNPSAQMWIRPLLTAPKTPEEREKVTGISDAKAIALVREHFAPLIASMGNINNAPEIIDTYISAAAKVVQMGNMQDAYQFVQTAFLSNFKFVGPGSTIRLGADVPDSDAIGDGARNVLHDIGNHDLVIPSTQRLGPTNAKEAWTDAIRANGVWNTSPNGRTAILYDGAGNPVLENRNGRQVPVELDFDTLRKLGKGPTVTQATIQQEEEHIK